MSRDAPVPVVVCVYNRPEATRALMAALQAVRPARLLVVADGPKPDPADRARCAATAAAVRDAVTWPARVEWNVAPANLGTRRRITTGLAWAFEHVEAAIVLEDDCIPHPSFFPYCAALLARYRDDPRVAVVSGSNFQFGADCGPASYYFSRYPLIWGWAGWRRTWALVDADLAAWPARRATPWLHDLLGGDALAASYWATIFDRMRDGMDTWDFALLFSCWLAGALAIHPAHNLVRNIGFGPDATHGRDADAIYARVPAAAMPFPLVHPERVERAAARDRRIEALAFGLSPRAQLAKLRAARAAGARAAVWTPDLPPDRP